MIVRNNNSYTTFYSYNISNLVEDEVNFSPPNNTKYLVPSLILINPSILSNHIRKCLEPIKVLHEMLQTKILPLSFSSNKISFETKYVIKIIAGMIFNELFNSLFFVFILLVQQYVFLLRSIF